MSALLEAIARRLPHRKAEDYDVEADARAAYAQRTGHELPMAERRARALRLAASQSPRRQTLAG